LRGREIPAIQKKGARHTKRASHRDWNVGDRCHSKGGTYPGGWTKGCRFLEWVTVSYIHARTESTQEAFCWQVGRQVKWIGLGRNLFRNPQQFQGRMKVEQMEKRAFT
jgi:hypothetical protein